MKQVFIYKEKFAYSILFPALLFIGLAIGCYIHPFGVKYKSFHFLSYPNSLYIFCGGAIMFILYACYKYLAYNKSQANPNPITIESNFITFAKTMSKDNVVVNLLEVKELWNKSDDDDGESMIIYSGDDNRHEFFAEKFQTLAEFAEFKKSLEEKCINITNRK